MTTTNDDRAARALRNVAARVAVATLVVLGILAVAAVLWAGRVVVALLFLAIVIASAIRPSVEALRRRRVPRGVGVSLHYAVLLGLTALVLWWVIPAAIDQVQAALGPSNGLREEAQSVRLSPFGSRDSQVSPAHLEFPLLDPQVARELGIVTGRALLAPGRYDGSLRKCSATREPANTPKTMRIAVMPRGAVCLALRKTTSVKMMATAKPTMPPAIRPTHSTAEEA
jgi:AI-2E family transporter